MGAQTDFLSQRTREISSVEGRGQIWRQFLGGALQDVPDVYRLASPLVHLDKSDPPCWFITGENDDASTQADKFRSQMGELNIPANLSVITDAPHPFLPKQIWFDQMINLADAHFKKTLK
jgi:pectinesterase